MKLGAVLDAPKHGPNQQWDSGALLAMHLDSDAFVICGVVNVLQHLGSTMTDSQVLIDVFSECSLRILGRFQMQSTVQKGGII